MKTISTMAKPLLWEIVHIIDHRWRSPLIQKEELMRPLVKGGWGKPFILFPISVLASTAPSSSASRHLGVYPKIQRLIWWSLTNVIILVKLYLSLRPQIKDIELISCFHLSKGAFGNKNGLWVLTLLGWRKKHRLIGVSSQIGFARESLGEPTDFQVAANRSQQLCY